MIRKFKEDKFKDLKINQKQKRRGNLFTRLLRSKMF